MVDQNYDRDYQAGRATLNAGIDDALKSISRFFATTGRAIHKFEFDAPWNQPVAPRRRARRVRTAH
jgi:hypothetical protein